MFKLFKKLVLLISVIALLGFSGREVKIKAWVDKDKVVTGEIFTYHLDIEGIFYHPDLNLPKFKNFKVISQSHSKSYSYSASSVKTKIKLVYSLFATQPGKFRIEPVILIDEGKAYKSQVITIVVEGKPLREKEKILPYIEKSLPI